MTALDARMRWRVLRTFIELIVAALLFSENAHLNISRITIFNAPDGHFGPIGRPDAERTFKNSLDRSPDLHEFLKAASLKVRILTHPELPETETIFCHVGVIAERGACRN